MRYTSVLAITLLYLAAGGGAMAGSACRGSKVFDECQHHQDTCPVGDTLCESSASSAAYWECQRYRVPCSFQGTYGEQLELSRYPTVGGPFRPPPGDPNPGDQKSILESLFPNR